MIVKATISVAFEATNKEDAFRKLGDHFAMLARMEGNGMKYETGSATFDGSIEVLTGEDAAPAQG